MTKNRWIFLMIFINHPTLPGTAIWVAFQFVASEIQQWVLTCKFVLLLLVIEASLTIRDNITIPVLSVKVNMTYCKMGTTRRLNLFSVCAECLSWNVILYLKTLIHTPCYLKSTKSGHLWYFRAMFYMIPISIVLLSTYNATRVFEPLTPKTLWYEFKWHPF